MRNDLDGVLIPSKKGRGKPTPFLTAFILSAGLGERLRPITNYIPKPLMPILGRPVLELILEKVLPFANTIGINLHHKKELISEYLNNSAFKDRITTFYEEPILGTGGALKNAEALLSKKRFLTHNADILSDINLEKLVESHNASGNIATLAVHDYPKFNNLVLDEDGYLVGIFKQSNSGRENPPLPPFSKGGIKRGFVDIKAFTGIAVYEPEFLNFLPPGKSSVTDAWLKAVEAGHKIGAMDVSGCYWTDIGTPSAYASAVVHSLRSSGETIYIHSGAECSNIDMDGYVVIGRDCMVPRAISLRNCIILPVSPSPLPSPRRGEGTYLLPPPIGEREFKEISPPLTGGDKGEGEGFSYENCILCGDIKIDLDESEMLGFPKGEAPLIGVGGSDRRYYRKRRGVQSEVFVRYAKNDTDFHRHIDYTQFFRRHNIPVPELMAFDPDNLTAVFEDLGDLSLYSWLKCKREKGQIEEMYRKALDILLELHTTATFHASECPPLQERVFDYEHARWETDYFMEQFVKRIKGIEVKDMAPLEEEFYRLALRLDSFPKTIIHRDFQSQNIMVTKGIPRIIDYQGARMGPPAYDVASILWDPYSRLDRKTRETLLDYYILEVEKRLNDKFNESDFNESLAVCRLQRHMQALGAYGFLSSVKGKRYFLKHVPEGLKLLKEDIMPIKSEYPSLYGLVIRL